MFVSHSLVITMRMSIQCVYISALHHTWKLNPQSSSFWLFQGTVFLHAYIIFWSYVPPFFFLTALISNLCLIPFYQLLVLLFFFYWVPFMLLLPSWDGTIYWGMVDLWGASFLQRNLLSVPQSHKLSIVRFSDLTRDIALCRKCQWTKKHCLIKVQSVS